MKDLTKGNITKLLILFSLPLLLGNLCQQFYNLVDTKIVGYYLGEDALAAMGASSPFFGLFVGMTFGLGNGFAIIVARHFGAKREEDMKHAVAGSLMLSVILSIFMTVICLVLIRPLLLLLHTPEAILERSLNYIRIVILFLVVMSFNNILAALLRALGDTIRPLIFLVISAFCNVGLDCLFVGALKMDVDGAAWATVISQMISVTCCLVYILKKCPQLHVKKEDFKIEGSMILDLLAQGASMGFMLGLVNIGTLILQGAINKFDLPIITAHTIARKLSELFMTPVATFGVGAATFTSQNFGAGRYDRIRKGVVSATLITWIWSLMVIVGVYGIGTFMIKLVSSAETQTVIDTALWYLKFDTPFYFVLGVLIVLRNAMQGLGRKVIPMISSCIELLGKILVVWFVADMLGYFGVIISEPVTWIACSILLLITFLTGKTVWKKVEEEEAHEAVKSEA